MIVFNYLGQNGRLANQMFQYASLRGIAATKGYDFCIPKTDYGDKWKDNKLFDVFEMTNVKNVGFLSVDFYPEKQFHYDLEYVNNCPDNVNLHGYYQSEKYFKHIEDSIREDFTFKDYILEPCVSNFKFDEIIALHVRRTDYVSNSANHPPCDLLYYERALEHFDSNIPVIIFSDDVGWCQSQSLFDSDRFIISESHNEFIDLCLMSMCDCHIIANSSFSWWGAWLSKSKKVIAPLRWFGENGNTAKNQTQDLYLNGWIKI
tara:strand:+ start:2633 stop:3415 length:783 start_codon:yes stop_codon:yes gene_type:complete